MYQSWGKLLFMHWPVPAESLRPLIPQPLAIDTHDGIAWVGITPFTMWSVRPVFAPVLPYLSESHELNVRTYVHLDGVPGVWFFSLDANNAIAILEARLAFRVNRVLVYLYLISLTGVASGIVFFGEILGFEKLVGGAVTLFGVYLARRQ